MPESRTGNELADKTIEAYELALQTAVARALDGQLTKRQLADELYQTAVKYMSLLYVMGGGNLDSKLGKLLIANQKRIHKRSANKLAADVFSGRYNAKTD